MPSVDAFDSSLQLLQQLLLCCCACLVEMLHLCLKHLDRARNEDNAFLRDLPEAGEHFVVHFPKLPVRALHALVAACLKDSIAARLQKRKGFPDEHQARQLLPGQGLRAAGHVAVQRLGPPHKPDGRPREFARVEGGHIARARPGVGAARGVRQHHGHENRGCHLAFFRHAQSPQSRLQIRTQLRIAKYVAHVRDLRIHFVFLATLSKLIWGIFEGSAGLRPFVRGGGVRLGGSRV
mmetsp:Transcript_49445/g.124302  ORF Transcript_49445/g.124302 Transcript_49445/m.124302 type:complete len:236 (-) Transcript_49445:243-950(-)